VVTLSQDGRVLDGWLRRFEHLLECERVLVEPREVDDLLPQCGSRMRDAEQPPNLVVRGPSHLKFSTPEFTSN
jgi:hypothetical protein